MEKLQNITDLILRAAKELGADTAQCTVSESETREFNVDSGEFSLMRTLFDHYVSISVLKGRRLGTVTVNRFDEDTLRAAVADCVAASESAEPDEAREFAAGPIDRDFDDGAFECDAEGLFRRVREFMDDVTARHPKLLMEQLIASHIRVRRIYRNTNGVTYRTRAGQYSVASTYSAHDGEESTSMYGGSLSLTALDKPFIEMGLIDREMSLVEAQLGAKPLAGKFVGTAVYAPSCLAGDVFYPILGNFASDGALLDGTSPWKDKLGTQVADARIDASFAPSDPRIVCGQKYTGEGYPAEDFHFIRDGVLESFQLSRYAANKLGLARAGNTSFALIVRPGETALDDIIAGIDRGVLLMRFSGGAPAPSGEFSGVAKNGFLIENGRLSTPLTETMISGNLADMLQNLRAVSRETLEDGDMSVPYMAFDGVTVSGK